MPLGRPGGLLIRLLDDVDGRHDDGRPSIAMYDLHIFDLDNTLASRDRDTLSSAPAAWLREHRPQRVAIATNQGGVGMRYWMDSGGFGEPEKFPTETAVRTRLAAIADAVRALTGGQVRVYMAFSYLSQKGNWSPTPPGREAEPEWSQAWRKPNPGMLLQAAADFGVSPEQCIYVGDSISNGSDEVAAVAAGMAYIDEKQLFGRVVTVSYRRSWPIEWLRPHERIGLDVAATYRRFEQALRDNLMVYHYILGIEFEPMDEADHDFHFDEASAAVLEHEIALRWIRDMDINRRWLVYLTAEEHAEALANHPQYFPSLTGELMDIYGLSAKEAIALRDKARQ
jgi:hypothetical protein